MGTSKAVSAAGACMRLNSRVRAVPLPAATAANVAELVASHDLVLDCTDSVPTRYMLSDAAAAAGRPLVSGAAVGFEGQARKTASYFGLYSQLLPCRLASLGPR